MSQVKDVTNVNWSTAGSVVAGLMLFGVVVLGVAMLPNNAITKPVKKVVDAAS